MSAFYIDMRICGIPASVHVGQMSHRRLEPEERGNLTIGRNTCTDMEYTICDRNGRPAGWLERKMTDRDYDAVEEEIASYE